MGKGGLVKIGQWLVRLGGAQQDVLDRAPGDVAKQTSLGAVLLGTAVMAAVSATFALSTAVRLPIQAAAIVGVLWGLLILNLDRMLVVSMVRRPGIWPNIATAVPRVILALLIGTVISLPLVLRIFEPEINAELQVMRNEALGAAQTRIQQNPRFAEIPQLEAEEKRLQGIVSGQTPEDVTDDPDVKKIQDQLTAKEAEFRQAENDIICENDGTCGTGKVGRGPSYREKLDRKNRLEGERNALQSQLNVAQDAARRRLQSGSQQAQGAAKTELDRVQKDLDARRAEQAFETDKSRAAEVQNDGLLARIEALDRLSTGRPTMWLAHLTLILMFVCIELLPVLAKMMSVTGPKSRYEELVEMRDADATAADQVWSAAQRDVMLMRVDVRKHLEQDRADAQVIAGKKSNASLVAAQQDIADKAVEVWAEVASRRADAELAKWLAQYGGGAATGVGGPYSRPRPAPNGVTSGNVTNGPVTNGPVTNGPVTNPVTNGPVTNGSVTNGHVTGNGRHSLTNGPLAGVNGSVDGSNGGVPTPSPAPPALIPAPRTNPQDPALSTSDPGAAPARQNPSSADPAADATDPQLSHVPTTDPSQQKD